MVKMNAFLVIMVSLVACISCLYNVRTYHRPRYARTRIGRAPFGVKPFGKPPWGRPASWNRPRPRLLVKSSPASLASLRDNKLTAVSTVMPENPDQALGVYGIIHNGQVNATEVPESKYPWIARVVVGYESTAPMLCNAACVEDRIFITTARCLYDTKVYFTRVIYQDEELKPIAFVVPSKPTKTHFDDIGIIVVDTKFTKQWNTTKVQDYYVKRTDDQFKWTLSKQIRGGNLFAVGHVMVVKDEIAQNTFANQTEFKLYQLGVVLDPFLCNYLYNVDTPNNAYFVPCYHTCDLDQHYSKLPRCYNYLGGEGHLVIGEFSHDIYGIASWGGQYQSDSGNPPLPIGVTIPNSDAYFEDLKCAQKIKAAPDTSERFDKFCN